MMKVLLLNTDRFVGAKAGTERVLCNMANALVERGYEVAILCVENKDGDAPYQLNSLVKVINCSEGKSQLTFWEKLRREFIFDKKKKRQYIAGATDEKIATRIAPVLNGFAPDIIICYQVEGVRIVKQNISPDCPVIAMFHFNPEEILDRCFDSTIAALEKCEKVQVLLKSYVAKTKQYIDAKDIVYIPNAVPQFDSLHNDVASKCIIHVGRFSKRQKRQHLLIEAFGQVAEQNSEWILELWGEPDKHKKYYEHCRALVKKYRLEERVKFRGTTNMIFEKMQSASIFAFPSAFEGFPLALTEAMSIGLSSIGFQNCPGANELIKDGQNGILCDENIDSLANALTELMQDEDKRKRYGAKAKEDMKAYASEKIWDMWEALIQETVKEYKAK